MMNKSLYKKMANDETFSFQDRTGWFLDRVRIEELFHAWNAISAKKSENWENYSFVKNAEQAGLVNRIYRDVDLQRYVDAFGVQYVINHIATYNANFCFITMNDKGDIFTIDDLYDYLDWQGINDVIIKFLQNDDNAVDYLADSIPDLPSHMETLLVEYQALLENKNTVDNAELKDGDFIVLWVKRNSTKSRYVRIVKSKEELSSNFKEMISHYVTTPEEVTKYVKTFDKVHYLCTENLTAGCYIKNFHENEVLFD